MPRLECLEILSQLKLTAMSGNWDEIEPMVSVVSAPQWISYLPMFKIWTPLQCMPYLLGIYRDV